ncbi:putative protein kinase [Leptomonas pyrrhocoris]|uniref:Protein kinase domain-containing protein n=1 Tax=Leptomonas pyrrhocoris TaxID=157538 RepID=A0A0M9FSJ2_LEPPY|nr:putative protein kinase [Leptomonas pyrrhocoris]KPA74976.1 putative protein kinase [Leptomonas pyrrhocoris]|eukprot:XP_015653415.1 putative protein kinase [Leptomonas pyrrhocoris]
MSNSASSTKVENAEGTAALTKATDFRHDSTKKPAKRYSIAESGKTGGGLLEKAVSASGRRSPIRSRIAVVQSRRVPSRMDSQPQVVTGNGNCVPAGGNEKLTQPQGSGIRPLSPLDSLNGTAAPHEGRFKVKKSNALHKASGSAKATDGEASSDSPAFEDENRFDRHPNGSNTAKSPDAAGQSNRLNAADRPSRLSGDNAAQQHLGGPLRPTKPPAQQLRQLSASKEGARGGNADPLPNADVLKSLPPIQATDQEPRIAKQSDGTEHRSSGEARGSGPRPSVTRTGNVLDTHGAPGDAITTDTRGSISRSRRSAQVLRGFIGNSDKRQGGVPGRLSNGSGVPNNRVSISEVNPLHHASHMSALSEGDGNAEMPYHSSYDYEDGSSLTQSSATEIEVRADDLHPYADDGGDTFCDEQSFANRRGELEWLRTPSLFYFFANVIKWNELQLQRREFMSLLQARQQQGSQASVSIVSIWTQHRERELRTLEANISFSAFELEGVYLNRLLMRWSKPKLRSLVADVVATWKKEGPSSAKFDRVSSRLFDAISSEEACQLRCTWVFRMRQWLGLPQHRWIVTGMLIACFVVAILCIVFLAVFGRAHEVVCIVLSAVLGVAVVVMYVLALFILHNNTYTSAAATYFREVVVRAAQQRMEKEELEEGDSLTGVNSYVQGNEEKYGGPRGRGMGGLANSDDADARSDYTTEQTSLAVRNLRALTEGNAHPAGPGAQYYRIPDNLSGERRGSGTAAGGYYDDDMTLTDDNAPSLTSRPPQAGDGAKQKQDLDRDNTLLLSNATYEQHQKYLKQRQSLLVQETMSSSKVRNDGADATREDRFEGHTNGKEHVSGSSGGMRDGAKGADGGVNGSTGQQQLANLPDKVNITALIYCDNANLLSEVAPSLWDRMFILLRVADLHALDSSFKHGSERFKVILIHAADAPDGSEVLHTALTWLQVERRPVFFISRQANGYPYQVPPSARLKVPFTSTAINTLFLAGLGVEAELGGVSFPALMQQEQSPSQPFQAPPYVLGRRLGGGAFGNVFEAEMEQTGAKCAVKRMYLKEDSDDGGQEAQGGHSNITANTSARGSANGEAKAAPGAACHPAAPKTGEAADESTSKPDADCGTTGVGSQLREIAQEVEIMSSLQHPSIVRYYFCERDDNCISIFMELCTGGSLSSLIHSGKLVNPPEVKLVLREIISAVAYLHSLRIVHRDLKPDNVLFRLGHVKITDFGTAVHKHGGDLRLIKGTFAYMAPETLVGEPYGSACDVWSIGCIAAEILSVDLPQHALGLPAMCEYYRNMENDSTLPIECDVPGVRDFLLACLRRNPNERSTAAELFYHPILQARDASIQSWMQKVVEQRRHRHILQHKMSHRIGPGGRGSGVPGSAHARPNSPHRSDRVGGDGGDGFDLSSGNGSVISLDSSQLTEHDEHAGSVLTQETK